MRITLYKSKSSTLWKFIWYSIFCIIWANLILIPIWFVKKESISDGSFAFALSLQIALLMLIGFSAIGNKILGNVKKEGE